MQGMREGEKAGWLQGVGRGIQGCHLPKSRRLKAEGVSGAPGGTSPNGKLHVRVELEGTVWPGDRQLGDVSGEGDSVHSPRLDKTTYGWGRAPGCSRIYGVRRRDESQKGQRRSGQGRRRETRRVWRPRSQVSRQEGKTSFDRGC